MTVISRRGTPSFRTIEVAADASGGETMAPRRKAIGQVMPIFSARKVIATASVVKRTRPTASSSIGRRLDLKSRHEVEYAAEKRIGGRKRAKTISGFRERGGSPGTRLRTRLPTTRTTSVGTFQR